MGKKSVVLVKAVLTPDGRAIRVSTPFEQLPDWAKTLVNPIWDHPDMCECAECWQAIECSGR